MDEPVPLSTSVDGGTGLSSDLVSRPATDSSIFDSEAPSDIDYATLAGFRYHLRRFFAFSEAATQTAGLSPMHYQAMLAIKAHTGPDPMSVTALSGQLFIRLNTAVELVGRMETAGLVVRRHSANDRRRTELRLTERGETLLAPLAKLHLAQHRKHLPELMLLLSQMAESVPD